MRIIIDNINHKFDFDKRKINRLVIENPSEWRNVLLRFKRQMTSGEEYAALFDGLKELSVSKYVEVIYSPIDFGSNQVRLLNKLYKSLAEDCVTGEKLLETMSIKAKVSEFVGNAIFDKEISLTYNDDFDIMGLFKLTGVKIDEDDSDLISKILDYMLAVQDLDGNKIFIVAGLSDFLTYEDKSLFYETVISKEIKLLLIDRNLYESHRLENIVIIDKDLCEIMGDSAENFC